MKSQSILFECVPRTFRQMLAEQKVALPERASEEDVPEQFAALPDEAQDECSEQRCAGGASHWLAPGRTFSVKFGSQPNIPTLFVSLGGYCFLSRVD